MGGFGGPGTTEREQRRRRNLLYEAAALRHARFVFSVSGSA